MHNLVWQAKYFKHLSVEEYFDILYLRTAVFVVEQNCPYQEVDEKDKETIHLFGRTKEGELIAVSRILPQGVSYSEVSIGRVALKKEFRGTGIADELLQKSLQFIEMEFGKQSVRISAQQYLLGYYKRHGFLPIGEGYLEDDIPHIEMLSNLE